MKKIYAKFTSICEETGKGIRRGEEMIYDYKRKKCYCKESSLFKNFEADIETRSTAQMVQAQEEAYFDRFNELDRIPF